jgi:heterodisulfide reductase subunit A-like polyferredoxin
VTIRFKVKDQGETMEKEIIITGFGGQGVVLAGRILGKAATIGDKRESTLVQSYGPESRGGVMAQLDKTFPTMDCPI